MFLILHAGQVTDQTKLSTMGSPSRAGGWATIHRWRSGSVQEPRSQLHQYDLSSSKASKKAHADCIDEYLVFSDLKSRSADGFPNQYANLSKPANIPSLSGGYLWADEVNKCFYQFGGEYTEGNTPKDFSIWTYDVLLNQWNTTNPISSEKMWQRPAYGAGTQAESRGTGYYYGGYISNRSTPGWKGPPMALSSIVQFDFTTGNLRNSTHPDGIGRAEGQLLYLPASDGGLLGKCICTKYM
jgi:hypothetical protein